MATVELTAENFNSTVSGDGLVLVDFWAAWCGPCLVLGPVLEKLAREYEGQFVLAKLDIDREPELSAQFGVRSIPAVFGVRDGRIVDGFVGVQPEPAIRLWLDRLMPTPAEMLVAQARQLELADPGSADRPGNAAGRWPTPRHFRSARPAPCAGTSDRWFRGRAAPSAAGGPEAPGRGSAPGRACRKPTRPRKAAGQ